MPRRPSSLHAPSSRRAVPDVSGSGSVALVLIGLIHLYRLALAPLLGPGCRFAPSCSAYALESLVRFGAARGTALALRRLLRCHPWQPGGYDPVPRVGG